MADCKIIYYNSSTSSIQLGNFLYQNQAQTIPVAAGYYAWANDDKWYQTDAEGVVILSGSCSPIQNLNTTGLIAATLLGCISSSNQGSYSTNTWLDAYFTGSIPTGSYNVGDTGTGSAGSAYEAIQVATASFQAYDFTKPYYLQSGEQRMRVSYFDRPFIQTGQYNNQQTLQIWGAINLATSRFLHLPCCFCLIFCLFLLLLTGG